MGAELNSGVNQRANTICVGVDLYNQTVTGDVSITIRSQASFNEYPVALIVWSGKEDKNCES